MLRAAKSGVRFSRTATLGRQNLSLKPAVLIADARRVGLSKLTDDVEAIYAAHPYADELLRRLGVDDLDAVDASDYEGANIVFDMNDVLPEALRGRYDCVFDGGAMEHVFDLPRMIRNLTGLLKVGGTLISINGANNLMGHGFYQFSPEFFFRVFSPENGFQIEEVVLSELHADAEWRRVSDPASIGKRLQIANLERTYIMVRARKIADVDMFAQAPLQSDYAAGSWQGLENAYSAPPKLGKIRKTQGPRLKALSNLARTLRRAARDPYGAPHLTKIDWAAVEPA